MALCSLASDYIYVEEEHALQRKRWFALDLFLIYAYVGVTIPSMVALHTHHESRVITRSH
jgi:hypothetical protein